jgi:hypothetical protein
LELIMEMYLDNPTAAFWTFVAVVFLFSFAFGTALTIPMADAKAGRGARHRAPGLPKLIKGDGPATVTGLARAARREVPEAEQYARELGMAGGFSMPFNVVER